MKAERVILSFVAILFGLLVAGGAFFVFQLTRKLPPEKTRAITLKSPATPTPDAPSQLSVQQPRDEEVFTKKTITISGKTSSDATIVVSSETDDQVVKPTRNGDFSVTHTIGDDSTIITILSIFPDGREEKIVRTVNFSTEDF